MAQPPLGTTGVISVASGTQTTNITGAVQLPGHALRARLKAVVVDSNNLGVGPVSVEVGVLYGQTNSLITLFQGWVRGDANYAGSDSIYWTGDLPLGLEPCKFVIYARNDTGSTVSLAYGFIVEYVGL